MKINKMGGEENLLTTQQIKNEPVKKAEGASAPAITDSVSLSSKKSLKTSDTPAPELSMATEETRVSIPWNAPPYGKSEYYQPHLVMSSKKPWSKGERLAPVKMNFDGDWNILNNKENYKKDYYGNDKVNQISKEQGTVYTHEMFSEVNGEKYKVYQYWYYWAENPFYIDQHEHDLQYVQVYVKENGQPKWVFTNSHMNIIPYLAYGKKSEEGDVNMGKVWENSDLYNMEKSGEKGSVPEQVWENANLYDMERSGEGNNIIYRPSQVKWKGSHPVVYVAQNSHALAASKKDFAIYDKTNKPYVFEGTLPNVVSLDDPNDKDNPFPGYKDEHGLLNKDGDLKHHGFFQNPFVKVKGIPDRVAFKEGAHAVYLSGGKAFPEP
ncbi:MAG: hypothetical protein M1269_02015 [Chloroflexi bacterium]|nr:hypothetical protein [Chloroflexota bacterium]